MNWRPLHLLTDVSISVGAVMQPAGPEKGIGVISATYYKTPPTRAGRTILASRSGARS